MSLNVDGDDGPLHYLEIDYFHFNLYVYDDELRFELLWKVLRLFVGSGYGEYVPMYTNNQIGFNKFPRIILIYQT